MKFALQQPVPGKATSKRRPLQGSGRLPCPGLVLAVAAMAALSGCGGSMNTGGRIRLNATEQMMWSTYPLGTMRGSGTGIVVSLRERRIPGGILTAVVTSSHVLETAKDGPVYMIMRVPDAAGDPQAVLMRYSPRRENGRFFVRHPNQDVAAFALHIPPEAADTVTLPTCLNDKAMARSVAPLHVGDEVSFAGYPEVMPEMDGAFPVLRSGRVASYRIGAQQGGGMFYIDADAYPGDSGAPVFAVRNKNRPQLAGMIVERVGQDRRALSHLAVAVDAAAIRETLRLLADREAGVSAAQASPR